MAGRAIPGPGDFVAPGMPVGVDEMKPVNDEVFQKMKAELDAKELGEPAPPEQPVKPGGVPPRPAPRASFSLTADPFLPIEERGQEDVHTLVFIVRDNRPNVVVPLSGPGAYMITIRRTVEAKE